jgi:hypothetical protein
MIIKYLNIVLGYGKGSTHEIHDKLDEEEDEGLPDSEKEESENEENI